MKGKPVSLKFYLDENYTTEVDLEKTQLNGIIYQGDNMVKTVTVYWKWDYDGIDDNDYQDKTMSFNINVIGSQVI